MDISLIPLLLKVFAMFQMGLFQYKHNEEEKKLDYIFINCSNCDRSNGLLLKVKQLKKRALNLCEIKNGIMWVCLG